MLSTHTAILPKGKYFHFYLITKLEILRKPLEYYFTSSCDNSDHRPIFHPPSFPGDALPACLSCLCGNPPAPPSPQHPPSRTAPKGWCSLALTVLFPSAAYSPLTNSCQTREPQLPHLQNLSFIHTWFIHSTNMCWAPIVWWVSWRYKRIKNRYKTVPTLRFFDFTMVRKWYAFSRNLTLVLNLIFSGASDMPCNHPSWCWTAPVSHRTPRAKDPTPHGHCYQHCLDIVFCISTSHRVCKTPICVSCFWREEEGNYRCSGTWDGGYLSPDNGSVLSTGRWARLSYDVRRLGVLDALLIYNIFSVWWFIEIEPHHGDWEMIP